MSTLKQTSQIVTLLLPLVAGSAAAAESKDFLTWAQRPPMGWNSWDCFATTVTEAKVHEQTEVMASQLAVHGWQYVVVDIQWYEAGATGYAYHAGAKLTLDDFGRLLPAENKFPSAKDGAGFKALAAFVHQKGLKFGVHLMRGIPRQAVEQNLPIFGTSYHAADIADKVNICPWNSDMYGIDMSKPGAQPYYNSVFALLASWGIDFIKVDDLARPYIRNEPEIEAVRKAIDLTGRPMVLSISPGETDIHAAAHVVQHANMWRISDDFWDHWSLLESQFKRLDDWTQWRQPGAWPDADMIPIGTIELGRPTWFTHAEQVTLMTLWCIARSPLMLGADLTKLDVPTLSLLNNDEVLAVDQNSLHNRQLFRDAEGRIGWIADVPESRDRYVALFNTRDPWVLAKGKSLWQSARISMETPDRSERFHVTTKGLQTVVLVADDSDSPRFWWPSLFRDLRWKFADGTERRADREYGSHGERINGLTVPEGAIELEGLARLDDAAKENAKGESLVFRAYGFTAEDLQTKTQAVPLRIADLGLGKSVRVRDLWKKEDLGVVTDTFSPMIEWHGARLYRISAATP